jgi:hypothetical protein
MVDKKMWTSWQVLTRISQKVSSSWLIDKKNKKSVNLLIRIDNWKINKNMFSPWLRLAGKTIFCLALNGGGKKKCDKSSHKYPLKVSSPWEINTFFVFLVNQSGAWYFLGYSCQHLSRGSHFFVNHSQGLFQTENIIQ